eukprot:CAMPEP_0170450664 /NCGR_PEP_ID=MMETSP0123-20130129/127_1 /TAXON_ID=182087 /ORGANISM="Favella ehrenbergii, Strain Fehren 1" /LENGTH=48 /DNA_ID= /DNA_START= /DNA_END= /DNA_ORIENTATION=
MDQGTNEIGADGSGLLSNLNMGQLVQNPGRGSDDSQRHSERKTSNIFA